MSIESLLKLDVSKRIEKKNNLSYLSWAWAWAEALKADPAATFKVETFKRDQYTEEPFMTLPGGTALVWVTVTMFGKPMTCQLPVMNHKNQPIPNPDAFQVNTALMRCMTKALGLHGLGLYIYAGEDLPEGAPSPTDAEDEAFEEQHLHALRDAALSGMDALAAAFKAIPTSQAKSRFWAKHQASLKDAAKQEKAA
jgi:Protein of unknown function (DUF1071)